MNPAQNELQLRKISINGSNSHTLTTLDFWYTNSPPPPLRLCVALKFSEYATSQSNFSACIPNKETHKEKYDFTHEVNIYGSWKLEF